MSRPDTYHPSPARGTDGACDDLVDADTLWHQPAIPRAGQVAAADGGRPAKDLLAGIGHLLVSFLHPTRSGSGRIVFLGGGWALLLWLLGQALPDALFAGSDPGHAMQYACATGIGMGGVLMWTALRHRASRIYGQVHAMVLIATLVSLGGLTLPGFGLTLGAPFLLGYGAASLVIILGRAMAAPTPTQPPKDDSDEPETGS